MDLSPATVAKVLLPRIPLLLKTAVLHTLSLSPNASKQDLRTELTVSILRELIDKPTAIGQIQRGSTRDPGIKGKMWIAKVTLPKPEDSDGLTPKHALAIAIKELGDGSETYTIPETSAVEAEWTGYRSGVDTNTPRPDLSEPEHYNRLMSEVKSNATILYFHGGVHIAMDPASHRVPTSHLAHLTTSRCLSIRYRLSPQHPFPSALLDALVAYLSLLSPPPSSLHSPIPPHSITLAGDSAGGNLCLSLLLLLLSLRRLGIATLRFHGRDIPLALPGALALSSPWCDISRSMPSVRSNAAYDYISPPPEYGLGMLVPPDEVWPVAPPRVDMYVNATALIHPLVSPLAARAEMWRGAPPVYMCVGSESLEDECAVLARRMAGAGVRVRFDGYEGMPHCFGMIFPTHPMGRECLGSWAGFIREVVGGGVEEGGKGESRATWAKALQTDPIQKVEVAMGDLQRELVDEEVERLMRGKRERYVEEEGRLVGEWREREGLAGRMGEGQPKSKL